MELAVSVTVTMAGEDGTEFPVSEELTAALAGPVGQFASMLTWTAQDAGALDHGDRETEIAKPGRELQRKLLQSAFTIDAGCEERMPQVTSAAGVRHGTVEKGHDQGVVSIFGPVRGTRMAYRNRREAKARRKARPGPQARGKRVAASITETIHDMIGAAYDEGDRRDPPRARQRVFLVDGNKQQITAIGDHARARGLKVPVLTGFIHVLAISARPPPHCTPATPRPPANGPTGRSCESCTAAPGPSPPPWRPSLPGPAPRPAPATWTWPTRTRPSPT